MKKYYALETAEKTADVYIFGDITSWPWVESDVSSYNLAHEIAGLEVDTINVHINSYGGEVAEGLAIYNSLKNHPAKIKTICDGFACSAASVIFVAGDERVMNAASLLMIHNAWTYSGGNAGQLRKAADDLETVTEATKAAYLAKIGIDADRLTELMDAETWILPADALEMGFATAIVAEGATNKAAASARKAMMELMGNGIIGLDIIRESVAKMVESTAHAEEEPGKPVENKTMKFLNALIGREGVTA